MPMECSSEILKQRVGTGRDMEFWGDAVCGVANVGASADGEFLKPQDWVRGSSASVNGEESRHEMSYSYLFLEAK